MTGMSIRPFVILYTFALLACVFAVCFPIRGGDHVRYTACGAVIPCHKSCGAALDSFQLPDVGWSVRIPGH